MSSTTKNWKRTFGLAVVVSIVIIAIVGIENPLSTSPIETTSSSSDIANSSTGTQIGERLPNFTLNTLDGKELSLTDFRGMPVLVNFWATWCTFCVNEMPDLQRAFENENVAVLGVNRAETIEKQLDFLKNNLRITYPILLDPSDSLARAFGVTIMPTTFVLNSEGIVIQHKLGQYASLEEITNAIKYGRSPLEEIPVKGKT
ncbi:MAG: hypothetical protein CMO12_01510 [Thaumarchaeota archaeon]|nr:hypothetical protein [Nitrososphaerota archaeon]